MPEPSCRTHPSFQSWRPRVQPGDRVLDIGANVGHYTKRISDLLGGQGQVIAVEPVPSAFALLAANAELFGHRNVTLTNAAASDRVAAVGIDDLLGGAAVALIKIDGEGREAAALADLQRTITAHKPTLIVETGDQTVIARLVAHGYRTERLPGSANALFRPHE